MKLMGIALSLWASAAFAITIPTVPIGNPGNAPDSRVMNDGTSGYGAVAYAYRIGQTEVTNSQYVAFLNAKAASDPLGLYDDLWATYEVPTIIRSGSPGTYTYAPASEMGDKPVKSITWYSAIRFCNWLNNGQGSGDTECGAYTLLGGTPKPSNESTISRNAGAVWFLPSEDEWYKAAYHQPASQGGDSDDYWLYPTASNSAPIAATANSVGDISNPGANVANYGSKAIWTTGEDAKYGYVTTVGSGGPLSESYYGTLDQGGNLWEWNETLIGSNRGLRGGAFFNAVIELQSFSRDWYTPWDQPSATFRVATIPEPTTLAMAALGILVLLSIKRHTSVPL